MEKIEWKVEGMDCTNCALTITRYLQKEGQQDVKVNYIGVSAFKSLRRGIPNMNVLIAVGATAAFVYSLIGTIGNLGMDYVFYETAATIITLVFLGEWIENKSVTLTQKELNKLSSQQ